MRDVRHFARNDAGRDWAVGDIHGCVSALYRALDQAGFDRTKDRLFSVGDLVDRGPESNRCDELIGQPWFFAIQGNHEDMAIRWPNGRMDAGNYASNGGAWNIANTPDKRQHYADVLSTLPVAMEVETEGGLVGIVHADCPAADWSMFKTLLAEPASMNQLGAVRDTAMWNRERITQGDHTPVQNCRAVVVGHTPLRVPVILGNVYHIDTMGWRPDGYFTFLDLATLKPLPRTALTWEGWAQ